jgi:hypothetical protein
VASVYSVELRDYLALRNNLLIPFALHFNPGSCLQRTYFFLKWLGTNLAYTNVADGDITQYFPPNSDPTVVYPNMNCGGANTNGAIVVNLWSVPHATAPGAPASSYGHIRFRTKVN